MMMSNNPENILRSYLQNTCTSEEKALVEDWYNSYRNDKQLDINDFCRHMLSLDQRVEKITKPAAVSRIISIRRASAIAASVLVVLAGAWLFSLSSKSEKQIFAPGNNNMLVYLDDNSEYNLSNLTSKDTIQAKGYALTKDANGALVYITENNNPLTNSNIQYNTIRTSAGGSLKVVLSDGSVVWINANSSLTYPIQFTQLERQVVLNGEAFFEVTKQRNKEQSVPFMVKTQEYTVKVLGTKFNVNAYKKYSVALTEGNVVVSRTNKEIAKQQEFLLQPGQLYENEKVKTVEDIEKYADWKDGYFNFTGSKMNDIKEKLENWYGVDIQLSSELSDKTFFGEINRSKSLNQVLELLREIGAIEYKISGNKVILNGIKSSN